MTNEELVMQYQLSEDYNVIESLIEKNKTAINLALGHYNANEYLENRSIEVLIKCAKSYDTMSANKASFINYYIKNLKAACEFSSKCVKCDTLLNQYRQGNTSVLDDILLMCEQMVNKTVNTLKSLYTTYFSFDDAKQIAYMAILSAVENFEIKDVPFYVGVQKYIRFDVINAAKKGTWIDTISLDKSINDDESNRLYDFIATGADEYEIIINTIANHDYKEKLGQIMGKVLTLKEYNVISMLYGWDNNIPYSLTDTSTILDITPDTIKSIENRSLRKLREALKGVDWYEELKKEHRVQELNQKYKFADFVLEE